MTSFLRTAASVAVLGLLAAPLMSVNAWSQAQGARPASPPAISQPAQPPAKPTPPRPPVAKPPAAKPIPAPAPVVRPAPKPQPPVTIPVARPAPRPAPTPVTPTVPASPRPTTVPMTPVIATAPGQSPVAGCTRPGQPAVPAQAAGVSLSQMDATRNAAVAYFAAADTYRACLDRFIEAERDKMFKNNTGETPELKRAAYEHSGFSEEKGRVFEAVTLFCYNWQSSNQRDYPGGCTLPWNPGG